MNIEYSRLNCENLRALACYKQFSLILIGPGSIFLDFPYITEKLTDKIEKIACSIGNEWFSEILL
jgi:hypothetical protein